MGESLAFGDSDEVSLALALIPFFFFPEIYLILFFSELLKNIQHRLYNDNKNGYSFFSWYQEVTYFWIPVIFWTRALGVVFVHIGFPRVFVRSMSPI